MKVLVLTTFHVDEAVYAALRAGASGFILKDAAPTELVAAVRAIAAGEAWLDPAVARRLIDEFAASAGSGLPSSEEFASLTSREREVLVLIAHGLSNAEISDYLVVGEGTTKTHVSRIFAKLGFRDRAQAVATAYKSGLVRPDDPLPPRPGARRRDLDRGVVRPRANRRWRGVGRQRTGELGERDRAADRDQETSGGDGGISRSHMITEEQDADRAPAARCWW